MPPFMGQGMCSGLLDAVNLSWKLKAVLDGDADDKFLDTYELERSPHVAQLTKMSIALGSIIMITDPAEGKRRDDALRSGTMPRPPPFPRLTTGIVRKSDSPNATDVDGRPGPQARVVHGRHVKRLDDFQKPGWKLISRHAVSDTLFNTKQKALLSTLQVQFAHVSRGAPSDTGYTDIDGEYDMWYRKTGRKAFLQRPDNYVFGSVKTLAELPELIDELSEQLKESGWHIVEPQLNGVVDEK
jgi:FAD binding domain